jgi:hypothetical protein
MTETRTYYYDADGNEVQDEADAVHAVKVALDENGKQLRELERWDIGPGPGTGYSGGGK